MQELTFEQVEAVSGGMTRELVYIPDYDALKRFEGGGGSESNGENLDSTGEWFSLGSGNWNCCFGIDIFNFNIFNALQDFGSFIGINGNLERERNEKVEGQ